MTITVNGQVQITGVSETQLINRVVVRADNSAQESAQVTTTLTTTQEPTWGFLGMQNGYFYDTDTGKPFVPHGIAYQTWNRPLGVWQTHDQIDYDLDEMKKMGANSIRVDFVWQHIEEKGDNQWSWENYDYLVQACEERNIRIFALIGYQWPPNWFPDDWYTKHPPGEDDEGVMHPERWASDIIAYENPNARAQYTEVISNICARYKNSKAIGGWIVGNEAGYLGLWSLKYDGYDDASIAAFRTWCQNAYGTIGAVNTMWGSSYTNFSDIDILDYYAWKGNEGAMWADIVQWHESSIADYVGIGAAAAHSADPNHMLSYSTVGMQWGNEDWRYHAEDRGKIAQRCAALGAPLSFFAINNYPWPLAGHESRNGQWGISYTKKIAGMPVLYSETGFTSSETLFKGVDERRQSIMLRNSLWESLNAGGIGTHIFTWQDRLYITDREKGFGIVTADRRLKQSFFGAKMDFGLMEQVDIGNLLMGSKDPKPDVAFLWLEATDSQYVRYEVEMLQIAGAMERLGYEPNFIMSMEELGSGAYTNYRVLVLPRNMRVDETVPNSGGKSLLRFLRENVIGAGVHVLATADVPGLQDRHGRHRAAFSNEVNTLFGIDASDASAKQPYGCMDDHVGKRSYFDYIKVRFTTNAPGVLSGFSYEPGSWKWNDRIKVTDGSLWAEMDSGRNWGFEQSPTVISNWTVISNAAIRRWGWQYEGTNMVQLWGASEIRQYIHNILPGERYRAEFFLRNNNDDPLTNGSYGSVSIQWFDWDTNQVGATVESARLTGPNNAWQSFVADGIAPEGAQDMRITVRLGRTGGGAPTGSLYVDSKTWTPAVVAKNHGTAKAVIILHALDFAIDSDKDGNEDEWPMKWRWDILGTIMKNYFGVQPQVTVSGANSFMCLPEYRTCADGSTLWQIKNQNWDLAYTNGGPPQTFDISSSLFTGKTVRGLMQCRIYEDNCDGTVSITLDPDGMEMLHVYPLSSMGISTQAAGMWKFEEPAWNGTSGEVRDSSGNNNHGRAINGAQTDPNGRFGRAAWFDGVNDGIQIPNSTSLQLTNDLTISFWIRPQNLGTARINPVDKKYGGEFALTIETNRSMNYYHGSGTASTQYWSWTAIPVGRLVNSEW